MPVFIAALIGGLVQACGTIVGRVLVSLGFSYAVFTGIDSSITWAVNSALLKLDGLPQISLQIVNALRVPQIISVIGAAITTKMMLNGVTGGTLRKLVQR